MCDVKFCEVLIHIIVIKLRNIHDAFCYINKKKDYTAITLNKSKVYFINMIQLKKIYL